MITHPNVKVNLGLSVIGKRPDGFHDIETLFVPYMGVADDLEIVEAPEFGIDIEMEGGVAWDPQTDLTARAYRMLAADFDIPAVHISLRKNAPVGAGLGGGSSDAAFALLMMDELFSLGLPKEKLAEYAGRLGSDCAFFVYNTPMFGSGRGEVLEPFDIDLSGYELRVVSPKGIAVSTAEAYRGVKYHNGKPLREVLSQPVETWKDELVNDFELTVFAAHPELADYKRNLYDEGAIYASMSGSGSSLFGLFPIFKS